MRRRRKVQGPAMDSMHEELLTRPDSDRPDQYNLIMGESMLLWLEEGVELKIKDLEESIRACQSYETAGLTYADITRLKGGNAEGISDNKYTADEDLMFLHFELARLNWFLFQGRYMRNNPNAERA